MIDAQIRCFFEQAWEQKLIKNEEDLQSIAKKPKRRERSEVRTAGGLGGAVSPPPPTGSRGRAPGEVYKNWHFGGL